MTGKVGFTAGATLGTSGVEKVAVADLNRDDSPDIFLACIGPDEVWMNDGHGRFLDSRSAAGQGMELGRRCRRCQRRPSSGSVCRQSRCRPSRSTRENDARPMRRSLVEHKQERAASVVWRTGVDAVWMGTDNTNSLTIRELHNSTLEISCSELDFPNTAT